MAHASADPRAGEARGLSAFLREDTDRGGRRSGVAELQRTRIIAALVEVAGERGAGGVTVAHIVARSGVSRRTFYELFEDRDACFLAAFDLAVAGAAQRVAPPFQVAGAWRERMRGALAALLEFLEDEPGLGRLLLVDSLGAGSRAFERRTRTVDRLIDAVDEGSGETRGSARPTRLTAEGVVGAVLAVLQARLTADRAPAMSALLGPLMGIVVLPYQGQAAAAREVSRPAASRRRASRSRGNPLHDLDMRLTYRTVRVLLTIAERPGASNREVADAAGVADQGQISKLLARLEHLGLIDNAGAGAARGERNVWRLTARGREIEAMVRQQVAAPADG